MNHTLTRIYCCCFDEESGNIYINNEKNGKFHFSFTRRWVLQSSGHQEQLLPATYVIFIQSQFIIILLSLPKKENNNIQSRQYICTHISNLLVCSIVWLYILYLPLLIYVKKKYTKPLSLSFVSCAGAQSFAP